MTNLSAYLISPTTSIKNAIQVIDNGAAQVALVSDQKGKLLGIVTDGDIRRAILGGINIEEAISSIMTESPLFLRKGSSKEDALKIMRKKLIHHVPVVDDKMRIIDLFVLDDLIKKPSFPNTVVLMAGGKGERLKPLTNNCPKPMLEVNGKPILEIILERCIDAGFSNFYISVNYLKDQIIDYFGDGSMQGVRINYLHEDKPLGTCGCLKLLPRHIDHDILVINGDILTDLDLDRLIRFHEKSENLMTICSRSHKVRIPFAVLNTKEDYLSHLIEKPMFDYQVNAGVYAVKPQCFDLIPASFYNMTDLIEKLMGKNQKVGVFPIHENWKDIGNPHEYQQVCTG